MQSPIKKYDISKLNEVKYGEERSKKKINILQF